MWRSSLVSRTNHLQHRNKIVFEIVSCRRPRIRIRSLEHCMFLGPGQRGTFGERVPLFFGVQNVFFGIQKLSSGYKKCYSKVFNHTTKIPRNDPREEERMKTVAGEGKKSAKFRGPTTLRGLRPSGPHPLWSQNSTSQNWPKSKLAEVELAELKKSWLKSKLAEVDHAPPMMALAKVSIIRLVGLLKSVNCCLDSPISGAEGRQVGGCALVRRINEIITSERNWRVHQKSVTAFCSWA